MELILISKIDIKEWIELIAQIILSIGVVLTFLMLRDTRKYNFLTIIEKCTNEYRKHARTHKKISDKLYNVPKCRSHQFRNDTKKLKAKELELFLNFLGLFNKQLYYIWKGYVPKLITSEWLLSMNKFLEDKSYFKNYNTIKKLQNEKDEFQRLFWYFEIKSAIESKDKKHKCNTNQEIHFKRRMLKLYYRNIKHKNPLSSLLYYKLRFRIIITL